MELEDKLKMLEGLDEEHDRIFQMRTSLVERMAVLGKIILDRGTNRADLKAAHEESDVLNHQLEVLLKRLMSLSSEIRLLLATMPPEIPLNPRTVDPDRE
jgi:hypothetical protein